MADITVQVSSPGLSVWGGGNWGELAYSDQGYTQTSVGQVSAYNEFGWGGGEYGEQDWGQLSDGGVIPNSLLATTALSSVSIEVFTTVEISGIEASTSIGQAESDVLNNGWGARVWGFSVWGSVGDVILTGQQLTASTGQAIASIDVDVQATSLTATTSIGSSTSRVDADISQTGIALTSSVGNTTTEANAIISPTSATATTASGQATIDPTFLIGEGWGRDTFGNLAWGVNYSVIGGGANGIELTAVTGNEDAFTDVTVAVSGSEAQTAITPVGTSANSDNEIAHSFLLTGSLGSPTITGLALVEPTGIAATSAIGDTVGGTIQEVPVSGIELTTNIGNEDTSGNADVSVTGIQATGSVGDIVSVSTYSATGSSVTASAGQVTTVGNSLIIPTGISLTASTGSPNIVAWQEVDTGTPVNWSEVDLAA